MEHPSKTLQEIASKNGLDLFDRSMTKHMDKNDKLAFLRDEFEYPKMGSLHGVDPSLVNPNEDCVYFCGNSLGLLPKGTKKILEKELDKWAKNGVYGHRIGDHPWADCDKHATEGNARLVGAQESEIAVMNGLTVNLNLLMISFYNPTDKRHKILIESGAFPSDHYAVESNIRLRGHDPLNSMICLKPREGEVCLRTEDILSVIEKEGDNIAVVMLPGIQYYTGQLFDMKTITAAAKNKGCIVGWDLAHAVGNVPIYLDDWNVDFAVWCTYKYMCTGAGGAGGAYINNIYANDKDRQRLLGWWAHRDETRFNMDNVLDLSPAADGFRISNPSIMTMCPMYASLEVFAKTNMDELREKSLLLTGYLVRCSQARCDSYSANSFIQQLW